jgi:geranylgeranyl diphosphate synthase type 3
VCVFTIVFLFDLNLKTCIDPPPLHYSPGIPPPTHQVFVHEMLNLHRGQGYDIRWRDSGSCPTETQYVGMVIDKTGGLFRLAVGLLQSFASANRDVDYVPLVNDLGLYFQIRDDLLNLVDDEYMKGKSFCEDLTEGKFSYPIIHCIRGGKGEGEGGVGTAASTQLLSILKRRTEDVDVKQYARRLMIDAGSLRYARDECVRLKTEIVTLIDELGGNGPLLKVIDALHAQVEKIPENFMNR